MIVLSGTPKQRRKSKNCRGSKHGCDEASFLGSCYELFELEEH
jgi:hypothetical protein